VVAYFFGATLYKISLKGQLAMAMGSGVAREVQGGGVRAAPGGTS